jgi:hypothetical protein
VRRMLAVTARTCKPDLRRHGPAGGVSD